MIAVILAGFFSILTPCVLPMIPIVVTSSFTSSKKSLFSLLLGYLFSFSMIAIFYTILSAKFDLSVESPRVLGAVLLIIMSLFMLVPALSSPLQNLGVKAENFLKKIVPAPFSDSSFFKGATMGLLWVPCVGPSLGIALAWVTATNTFLRGAGSILLFGISSTLALFLLGFLVHKLGFHWFQKQRKKIKWLYPATGLILFVVGVSVLTRFDKVVETYAVENLPDWWIILVSKY